MNVKLHLGSAPLLFAGLLTLSGCSMSHDSLQERPTEARLSKTKSVTVTDPEYLKPVPEQRLSEEGTVISRAAAEADIDRLIDMIDRYHSYSQVLGIDFRTVMEKSKDLLQEEMLVSTFALHLQKTLQFIGDSHAWVINWASYVPTGFMPVRFGTKGDKVFAYDPATGRLADADYPFVHALDGIDINEWFARAADIASGANSSASSRKGRGLPIMRYANLIRAEFGLEKAKNVSIELENKAGNKRKTIKLELTDQLLNAEKPFYLGQESKFLPGNIGYLRVFAQRGRELAASLDNWMGRFADTDALIIDARQCGGGLRTNLRTIFPYFMAPEDLPYIANVAKLRIPRGEEHSFDPKGKLAGKLKYFTDDDVSPLERQRLDDFLRTFEPQAVPPRGRFSQGWYFMAMHPDTQKLFYDKKVYLIVDEGVGSAGDIFASTFKSWRNVTIVGSPTNGRSGHSQIYQLNNSSVEVRLSTMASFQKDGQLYDWVGIQPDIEMEPEISDWLGRSDTILDRVHALATAATGTATSSK